ncbi:endonuclease/exonuclease/phosphatase family protein [Sulfitobacter sp. HNIBRBA3233]|uniref:endonuclease/exonuclease/phosphatase family protein n=1 Tax=Sulfitobacter marinivivus TaxID=3158558 RepID=UPI0032DF317C
MQDIAGLIIQIVTGLFVLASVLPLMKVPFGAVRGLAFPRVQIFWITLLLAVVAFFVIGAGPTVVVLLSIAALQMVYVAKFTPIWRKQSLDADRALVEDNRRHIRILTANVKLSNRAYDRLIDLTRSEAPDILVAIETDDAWCDALIDELGEHYPHQLRVPRDTGYGICLLSRLELAEPQVRDLLIEGVPSIRTILTLRSGAQIRLYVVHPEPPVINHDTKGRDGEIAKVGMEAAEDRLPTIVTGDLNDVAWSTTTRRFQRLSGLADPRVGRGFYNTFSAFHWWARWPLDHLFHDPQFRLLEMKRLPKIGSDHFPVTFALALGQSKARTEETGEADEEETEEVREMIDEERKRDRKPIGDDWEDED